ncbi:MAG: hypothetical protein ACRD1G_14860, partial [Acidimicrobiales bacterium]
PKPSNGRAQLMLASFTAAALSTGVALPSGTGAGARGPGAWLPRSAQDQLRRDAAPAAGLADRVLQLEPDLVLIAGYALAGSLAESDLPAIRNRAGMSFLPLAGVDPLFRLPVYRDALQGFRTLIAVTEVEHETLIAIDGSSNREGISLVPPVLTVGSTRDYSPPSQLGPHPYLLVVASDAQDALADTAMGLARYLRNRLPGVRMVVLDEGQLANVYEGGAKRMHLDVLSRTDVRRLMAGAVALIDLSHRMILGLDVLESMMLGTPVVVPADGIGRQHAERGDGGLWFTNAQELVECARALLDPTVRESLAVGGRQYATSEYGSGRDLVGQLSEALLGESSGLE